MADGQPIEPTGNLMERGCVSLPQRRGTSPVQRGMSIVLNNGCIIGHVAAVIVTADTRQATHLVLMRRCPHPQYQLMAVQAIAQVDDQQIRLHLTAYDVDNLPVWHTV